MPDTHPSGELELIAERAADLMSSLPAPPEFVHGKGDYRGSVDDVPPGLDYHLTDALDWVADEAGRLATTRPGTSRRRYGMMLPGPEDHESPRRREEVK